MHNVRYPMLVIVLVMLFSASISSNLLNRVQSSSEPLIQVENLVVESFGLGASPSIPRNNVNPINLAFHLFNIESSIPMTPPVAEVYGLCLHSSIYNLTSTLPIIIEEQSIVIQSLYHHVYTLKSSIPVAIRRPELAYMSLYSVIYNLSPSMPIPIASPPTAIQSLYLAEYTLYPLSQLPEPIPSTPTASLNLIYAKYSLSNMPSIPIERESTSLNLVPTSYYLYPMQLTTSVSMNGTSWIYENTTFVGAGNPVLIDVAVDYSEPKLLERTDLVLDQEDLEILNLSYSYVDDSYNHTGIAEVYNVYTYISSIHLVANISIPWNVSGYVNLSILVKNRFGGNATLSTQVYVVNTTYIDVNYAVSGNEVTLDIAVYYSNSTVPAPNEQLNIVALNSATHQVVYSGTTITNSSGLATVSLTLPPGSYIITISSAHGDPVNGTQIIPVQIGPPSRPQPAQPQQQPSIGEEASGSALGGYAHTTLWIVLLALIGVLALFLFLEFIASRFLRS